MKFRNQLPLVSIIMPAYNQAEFITEALDSLVAQTYTNWEAAIVDDGSPDNVAEVLRPYLQNDSRIKFYHTGNHGVSAARNFAAQKTSGELILPLDADDKFKPTYIEKCVLKFLKDPELRIVYSDWEFFGSSNHTPKLKFKNYKSFFIQNTIHCSGMYKRSDFNRIGGYDENLTIGFEDWEFWMRMLDEDAKVYQIPERLFRYRIKDQSRNTTANNRKNLEICFDYIFDKHRASYNKFYGIALENLMHLEYYKYRNEKWKNRTIFSRLWRAVKGKI